MTSARRKKSELVAVSARAAPILAPRSRIAMRDIQDFASLQIKLASPETMRRQTSLRMLDRINARVV